jgi:hypothetical protein
MRRHHLLAGSAFVLATIATSAAFAQAPAGAPPAVPDPVPAAPPPPPTATAGAPAAGDTAAEFGQLGQIAISGDLQASFVHESQSLPGGAASPPSTTVISIQPSLDYFVAPNVSVGGAIPITHGDFGSGNGTLTGIGILARAGYNLHLAPLLSLWPQLEIGYVHESIDPGGGVASQSGYVVPLRIFAPLLIHPVAHLFVGIGPVFQTDLISKVGGQDSVKTTDFGIASVVGGYFGGT